MKRKPARPARPEPQSSRPRCTAPTATSAAARPRPPPAPGCRPPERSRRRPDQTAEHRRAPATAGSAPGPPQSTTRPAVQARAALQGLRSDASLLYTSDAADEEDSVDLGG